MYEIHCTRCETTEETPTLYEPVHCKHCGDLLLAPPPEWQQGEKARVEVQSKAWQRWAQYVARSQTKGTDQ